jgi:hypothetical protein
LLLTIRERPTSSWLVASTSNIASDLAAVLVSHGAQGAGGYTTNGTKIAGAAGDEAENADPDLTFISRTPASDFNDLLIWITPCPAQIPPRRRRQASLTQ